ncbi:hypothetical protein EMEDMD4_1280024 [Sinorhizobium medicae]|uniref:Uncharacterized protein n=1 Tax=Sinorhizobium medicae TaxID=110321 RepID=A0A508WSR6_9HYPH|nr:hypothetical protein EMEDMD4_1280024 [Sinorhizobium medicae]
MKTCPKSATGIGERRNEASYSRARVRAYGRRVPFDGQKVNYEIVKDNGSDKMAADQLWTLRLSVIAAAGIKSDHLRAYRRRGAFRGRGYGRSGHVTFSSTCHIIVGHPRDRFCQ